MILILITEGEHPSVLNDYASIRVYIHEASDCWILLRSYIGFHMSVLIPAHVSMIPQPMRWWIFHIGNPHITWHRQVLGFQGHHLLCGCEIGWQQTVVAYSSDWLLASGAILIGISVPPSTMAYDSQWPIWLAKSCSKSSLYLWTSFPHGRTGEDSDGRLISTATEAMVRGYF